MNRLLYRFTYVLIILGMLSGCGWFGGDDNAPEEIEPTPLPNISQEVDIDVIWNRKRRRTKTRRIRLTAATMAFEGAMSTELERLTCIPREYYKIVDVG